MQLRKVNIAIVLLFLTGCSSNLGLDRTGALTGTSNGKAPSGDLPPQIGPSVSIVVDNTNSADNELLATQMGEIETALASLGPAKVGIVSFGADGRSAWYATERVVAFPAIARSSFDEAAVRAKAAKDCSLRKNCIDAEIAKAQSKADAEADKVNSAYQVQLFQAVEEVGRRILERPTLEPTCTDLNEVGDRILATRSDIVVLITDGQHNCPGELRTFDLSTKSVVVLVLPLKDAKSDSALTTRIDELKTSFLNATVLPLITSDAKTLEASFNRNLPMP